MGFTTLSLEAERALARFDALRPPMSPAEARAAALEETLASLDLAGRRVLAPHLLLALADPALAPHEGRADAVTGARLLQALTGVLTGRPPPVPAAAPPHAHLPVASAAVADARAALAEARAALAGDHADAELDETPVPCPPPALSPEWLAGVWLLLVPDAPVPPEHWAPLAGALRTAAAGGAEAAARAWVEVARDEALWPPPGRLDLGAARSPGEALMHRHLADHDGRLWLRPVLARLVWPWLLQRACGLEGPGPWLSPWGRAGPDVAGGEDASSLLAAVPALCAMETDRRAERRRRAEARRRRLGGRRASSRMPAVLALCEARLVIRGRDIQRHFGMAQRGADKILAEMRERGVLEELTGRRRDRVFALADMAG